MDRRHGDDVGSSTREDTASSPGTLAAADSSAGSLRDDERLCDALLPKVSRTFSLSIQALPDRLRVAVGVSYLLCRVVDSIEDEPRLEPALRGRLFDQFDALLEDDRAPTGELEAASVVLAPEKADGELCRRSGSVFRVFRSLPPAQRAAIRPHILEMSRGMREYSARADAAAGRLRIADHADLERYCGFVAGTVGALLTELFSIEVPLPPSLRAEAMARATSFGVGLQLTNIVKDVAEDLGRDACYLPESVARLHGIAIERLLDPSARRAGLAVLRDVCERAREHLVKAEEYTALWPPREGRVVRLFCAVPLAFALATLREVESGEDALRPDRAPAISRTAVERICSSMASAVDDDDALRAALDAARCGAHSRTPRPPTAVGRIVQVTTARGPKSRHGNVVSLPADLTERAYRGKVLVTGAAGHVGANLVRRLLREGRDVRVLLRRGSDNSAVDGLPVERAWGDLRDADTVTRSVRGCETVFHVAAKVSTTNDNARALRELYDCNVLGTRNLLRAARLIGVERVVVTGSFSAVGVNLEDPSGPSDETCPHDPFARHLPYGRTKVLVEHECLKAAVEGLDVVIVTSCAVLGPADHKPSRMGRALIDFTHGKLRTYIPGGFEFVSARDICEGHVLAMKRGQSGQRYIVSTEFLTLDQMMDIWSAVTGRPRPRLRLHPALMAGLAGVSSFVLTNFFPAVPQRFTPGAVRILRMNRRADISKARRDLGYRPTSIRTAIEEAYDDFARRGLVPVRRDATTVRPEPFVPASAASFGDRHMEATP